MMFKDRREAGRRLAETLRPFVAQPDLLVLGLPRGGIPVAYEVARALDAPLDVFVVRKLGVPGHEELAPVAAAETCEALREMADVCVCMQTPQPFHGVGQWYADFGQTTDAEVSALLNEAAQRYVASAATHE
jgi:predicted phosphoribosyltransferase